MEYTTLARIAESMLAFREDIPIGSERDGRAVLNETVSRFPKVLYYIASVGIRSGPDGTRLQMRYRNQNYPNRLVYTPKQTEIEDYLRLTVMHYEPKAVFALPSGVNFRWIMECFMTQSMAFYPNTKSNQIIENTFPQIPVVAYEVEFKYRVGKVMLDTMEGEVQKKVSQLQRILFPIPMPDSVKCYIAHNYLAATVNYWFSDEKNPLEGSYAQSAYGALIKGKCVCQGYAEAYKRILDSAGIPCDIVSGKVIKGGGWHAWNIVHLDNKKIHCHVDVTWDSNEGNNSAKYFLKGDREMEAEREWKRFFYSACEDGSRYLAEAKAFCSRNRSSMLQAGLRPEWIQ